MYAAYIGDLARYGQSEAHQISVMSLYHRTKIFIINILRRSTVSDSEDTFLYNLQVDFCAKKKTSVIRDKGKVEYSSRLSKWIHCTCLSYDSEKVIPDSISEIVCQWGLDKQIKEIQEVIEALVIAQPKGVFLYGPF